MKKMPDGIPNPDRNLNVVDCAERNFEAVHYFIEGEVLHHSTIIVEYRWGAQGLPRQQTYLDVAYDFWAQ
jgi:hypothetical protein